jgi:hypothetical protein
LLSITSTTVSIALAALREPSSRPGARATGVKLVLAEVVDAGRKSWSPRWSIEAFRAAAAEEVALEKPGKWE